MKPTDHIVHEKQRWDSVATKVEPFLHLALLVNYVHKNYWQSVTKESPGGVHHPLGASPIYYWQCDQALATVLHCWKGQTPITAKAPSTGYPEGHDQVQKNTYRLAGQTPKHTWTFSRGWRAGPVFLNQDQNHIISSASKLWPIHKISFPVAWNRLSLSRPLCPPF